MNTLEEMTHLRNRIVSRFLTANNPHLETGGDICEQLIFCPCLEHYLVYVNGKIPISDTIMVDIFCPHCEQPAANFLVISGHSAGIFNASVSRL